MWKKIIFVAVVLCLAWTGYYYFTTESEGADKLTLYGNIEIRQVNLSFQVPGKVDKVLKEEGDKIHSGELIAVLDDIDYWANHDMAVAAVAQTKAVYYDASIKFERNSNLYKKEAISRQSYDTSKYALEQAKANYDVAVAKESYTRNQLQYTNLYAPEDGIISVRVTEPGATVAAGQTIYTLSKSKPVWIRAFVNEQQLGNIKYGMKARVITDTKDPSTGAVKSYNGRIGYISPVAEFTPKTVQSTDLRTSLVYRIRVYVNETDDFLRQGMPATVEIDLRTNGTGHNRTSN